MAQKTDAELTTQSNVIATETLPNANTAARNGAMMQNIIDSKINNDQIDDSEDLDGAGSLAEKEALKLWVASRTIDGGAAVTEITPIQVLRGTAAQWTSANPTLAAGKLGFETDTYRLKIGNGSTAWNDMPYVGDHWRGDWAGTTTLPHTSGGGSGFNGVPQRGNRFRLSDTLVISGNVYPPGTVIEAAIDSPNQVVTNWIFYAVQI